MTQSPNEAFWANKRVLVTGHTGFKGSWLSLWLQRMGAEVIGYALPPPTTPSLFELANVANGMTSHLGDVRDLDALTCVMQEHQPEIVIHAAAQALVRVSYQQPVETYATNVMGTVHLLEAVRQTPSVRSVVIVTTDKCYENREWIWGYRENEPMGGHDPYSSSKGCAELVTAAYRNSFFPSEKYGEHGVAVASVRAGNVIGGGDWAQDRLIPDFMKAIMAGQKLVMRSPHALRPWQHVLEPLSGYLNLAEKLYESGTAFAGAWNFGPSDTDARPVSWIVERLTTLWGEGAAWELDTNPQPHEANYLKLDSSKARTLLEWSPKLSLGTALEWIVSWYKGYQQHSPVRDLVAQDIAHYETHKTCTTL